MSRTLLSQKRLSATREVNLGRIIIFCEGETEQSYFEYFSDIVKKNKYTEIKVLVETASGNAQRVLDYANQFMEEDDNHKKFCNYDKYLVFDCDAPQNIQTVILDARGNYNLLVSNYLFEIWLLMHFEDVETKLSKRKIYEQLTSHLKNKYDKANKGIIREIIQNGDVEKAINHARTLDEYYTTRGENILTNIKAMNPFTNVYKLIEKLMVEITIEKI